MDDEGGMLAELARTDGGVQATMTRVLAYEPSFVWRMLTRPGLLAQWLAPGRIEPRLGGEVRLDFADSGTVIASQVTAFEDGRLLAFSWRQGDEPDRPVRWDVTPQDAGTLLKLSVYTPDPEDPGRACAGWEAHLAMLEAALRGAPIRFPFERFRAAREAYRAKVDALAG